MMPARSMAAWAMACSAHVTDSSGVAGKLMLASAIRNVLVRHTNFIACALAEPPKSAHGPGTIRSGRCYSIALELAQ